MAMFSCSLKKMVISFNQLSLYGAVANSIEELPNDQRPPRKPVALDQVEQEILTHLPLAEVQANEERRGNLLQNYERRFHKLPEDQKLSKVCAKSGLKLIEIVQLFCALPSPRGKENKSLTLKHRNPRILIASRFF